jgi:hypothetical protein
VDVSPAQSIASLNFPNNNNGNSTVTLNSGITLNVSGAVTIPRANNGNMNTLAVGAGTLNAGSLVFSNSGNTTRHQLTISTGIVTVAGNVTETGGNSGSATIAFSGAGVLRLGGAIWNAANGKLTTVAGSTVEYYGAGAQTVGNFTYSNLTLSGSGAKTTTGATVNGILSMEGTATTAGTASTYGAAATLQYRGSAAQTTGIEFPATWAGSGGVIINNANGVTLGGNKAINTLNVTAGSLLNLGNFNATVSGVLTNPGIIRKTLAVGAAGTYNGFSLAGFYNGGALAINVTTQGTLSSLQVDRTDVNHPNATSGPGGAGTATGRYWTITPTGDSYTVDLTLPHNVTPDTNAAACEYTGGSGDGWDCARTSSTGNTVTRTDVTVLSPWAVGNNVGPTAVVLESVSAHAGANGLGLLLGVAALLMSGSLVFTLARRKAH